MKNNNNYLHEKDVNFSKMGDGWTMTMIRSTAFLGLLFGLAIYGISFAVPAMDTGTKLILCGFIAIFIFICYKLWRATPASIGGGNRGH